MGNMVRGILITSGVLLIVGVVVLVIGIWWLARNQERLVQELDAAAEQGKRFGASTTLSGCVDEALARHQDRWGIMDELGSGRFLRACLEAAPEDPEFCATVPAEDQLSQLIQGVQWSLQECERRGHAEDQSCVKILQEVKRFCQPGSS